MGHTSDAMDTISTPFFYFYFSSPSLFLMRRSAEDPGILPRCAFPLTFPLRLIIFVGVGKEKREERPAGRAGADLQSVTHTQTDSHTSRKPGLIQPMGLNYLNGGKEREGEDGGEEETAMVAVNGK